jgi:hypothetical protein
MTIGGVKAAACTPAAVSQFLQQARALKSSQTRPRRRAAAQLSIFVLRRWSLDPLSALMACVDVHNCADGVFVCTRQCGADDVWTRISMAPASR